MPLTPSVLQLATEEAFEKAMLVFAEFISNNPVGKDVSSEARTAAAKTFALIITPAIDAYIRSGVVTVASPTGPLPGTII